MEEEKYRTALRTVLDENSEEAIKNLNATLKLLPEKTRELEITIFPDQDGEGTFGVRVCLDGPDLYVLNKAIEDAAELINVVYTSDGIIPNVPLMDPFDSDFEVNDVLSDVVAEWIKSVWEKAETKNFALPVTIAADEDYGMTLPLKLN